MPKLSFETQDEKRMYERGRHDAVDEMFKIWHAQLKERNAFPDKDPKAFAKWGIDVLLPEMDKYRGQDDLFTTLMNI